MAERTMARDAGLVMLLIVVSRLLGFVRERAIAEVFGLNVATDIFRAAFNIPDFMFFLVVAGALNAAFLPTFAGQIAKGEDDDAWEMASTFFTASLIFLVLFTVIGFIFTEQLTPLVAYGFSGDDKASLVFLMRVMFPAVFFTALAGLSMGVHKAYKHFAPPMLGPIVYNVSIIAGAYLLGPHLGLTGMAIGTVAGAVGNFLVQVPFVLRHGWRRLRFRLNFDHPAIRRVGALMVPAMLGLSAFQVNLVISMNLASGLGSGSISALQVANRVLQFPLGVFAMGVGTVILPTLSGLRATGDLSRFRHTFSEGLRSVFFVTVPSAVGLAVLGIPIIRLLFEVGAFGPQDTAMTAYALVFYTVGLAAQSGNQVLMQVYYALQETRTIVRISLAAIALNTVLCVGLLSATNLGHGALALAWSITAVVNLLQFLLRLRPHVGAIDGRRTLRTVVLAGLASLPMGAAASTAADWVGRAVSLDAFAGRALQVAAGVIVGALVYVALTALFRMEELRFLRSALTRGRSARGRAPDPQ